MSKVCPWQVSCNETIKTASGQSRTVAKSSSEISKFNAWQVLLQCIAQLIKTTLEIMWRAPQIPAHSSSSMTRRWKDQDPCCHQAAPPQEWQPQFTAATPAGMHQEPEVFPGLPAATTPLRSQDHTCSCKHLFPAQPFSPEHIQPQAENENSWPRGKGSAAAECENVQEIQNKVKL